MKTLAWTVLLSALVAAWAWAELEEDLVDKTCRPASHPIVRDKPASDFFEGALLGNGGLGAVVIPRPDAVVVHFGHNDVWDIRIAEDNQDKIGTFREIFDKVKAISPDASALESDPWYRDYLQMTQANYRKPYPRPFPCGSLLLGFDRRDVETLGYRLEIDRGLCTVNLLVGGKPARLLLFVDMQEDRLWVRLVDDEGRAIPNCFERVRLIPDPDTPGDLPHCDVPKPESNSVLSFRQILPFCEPVEGRPGPSDSKDRAFRLSVRVSGKLEAKERMDWEGRPRRMGALERGFVSTEPLVACVQLDEGLASEIDAAPADLPEPDADAFNNQQEATTAAWERYWLYSGVELEDDGFLERIWYWNQYFFNCSAKPGVNCPGLFANWSYRNIGTAWHGDYHMNYNTQQPFWMTFSSNRLEKNLPYVELVERLLPIARKWANEYYGMRGAYFPHSAYPVEMNILPYPVPTWGWEICETPWTVQGLWWHYLYSMDKEFLRDRAFGPIRDAVLFLIDYMKRPEAHGKSWGDDKYHVFPTVPPELYGLKPGFKYNHDCLVDLTLIKFVMKAYLEAVRVLDIGAQEDATVRDIREILGHFPEYPTAESKKGTVFVSVPGEHADVVFNVPNNLMTVFPGEDHGLGSSPEIQKILENSYRNQQNEGGNELVFLNLQAARLGLLDLERFKRQIDYCLLPNGTCADMVLQVHGRYDDTTRFDFMRPMGIWFENFGLPAVINECLMQSYDGSIRLFPNWPLSKHAEFDRLRAVGAFLVYASCREGQVEIVRIESEVGNPLRLLNPWKGAVHIRRALGPNVEVCEASGEWIELTTRPGEILQMTPRTKSRSIK